MNRTYPVIFTKTKDCILVEVPDFLILTEGKDTEDAIAMAIDAISLTITAKEERNEVIPTPSKISDIKISDGTFYQEGESFISSVDINIDSI